MRWTKLAIPIVWLAGAVGLGGVTAAPPEVGQPFPDLVLPSLADGRPLSLADFRGRRVVLQVFASW